MLRAWTIRLAVVESACLIRHGIGDDMDKSWIPRCTHCDCSREERGWLFAPDAVKCLVPSTPHRHVETWNACIEVIELGCFLQRQTTDQVSDAPPLRLGWIKIYRIFRPLMPMCNNREVKEQTGDCLIGDPLATHLQRRFGIKRGCSTTVVQFSSTGALNEVSCNSGWAHPAWRALPATGAPLACARVNAAVRVMPVPETCAPAACAKASGAATVIVPPRTLRDGGDDRRLRVRAVVNGDGLAGAKA